MQEMCAGKRGQRGGWRAVRRDRRWVPVEGRRKAGRSGRKSPRRLAAPRKFQASVGSLSQSPCPESPPPRNAHSCSRSRGLCVKSVWTQSPAGEATVGSWSRGEAAGGQIRLDSELRTSGASPAREDSKAHSSHFLLFLVAQSHNLTA